MRDRPQSFALTSGCSSSTADCLPKSGSNGAIMMASKWCDCFILTFFLLHCIKIQLKLFTPSTRHRVHRVVRYEQYPNLTQAGGHDAAKPTKYGQRLLMVLWRPAGQLPRTLSSSIHRVAVSLIEELNCLNQNRLANRRKCCLAANATTWQSD